MSSDSEEMETYASHSLELTCQEDQDKDISP